MASGAWVWSFSDLCHVSLLGVVVVEVTDLCTAGEKEKAYRENDCEYDSLLPSLISMHGRSVMTKEQRVSVCPQVSVCVHVITDDTARGDDPR